MNADDIDILERRVGYDGFFKLDELRLRHRRFDGGMSDVLTRERFHIGRAVCILPFDPVRNQVLLIEQFRVGALDHPTGPWLLETVAGLLGKDEQPADAARRELLEEAGVDCDQIEPIGQYQGSPGAVNELVSMFVARADLGDAGGVHGLAHEHEDIKSHVMPVADAFALLDEGRVTAVTALLPLRWLQVHHNALRQRWQMATV